MDELKKKKKLQSKLVEEYFMLKMLFWFPMGKFLVLKYSVLKCTVRQTACHNQIACTISEGKTK